MTGDRRKEQTGLHFGDSDSIERRTTAAEEIDEATWGEVAEMCFTHSGEEWRAIGAGFLACCFFLYFFLFGLNLLGDSAKVLAGCRAGELFGDNANPISGLMIGILATVLLQSSSTTTSIIVSLVGSVVSVESGIYMIMGANIGTSVTNTIVAMGMAGNSDELERAFSGAVVHDLFNMLTVSILLPIEVITGYLAALTGALVKGRETQEGEQWEGPVKKIVSPLSKMLIIANKSVIKGVANGASCEDYYPINCTGAIVSYKTCDTGLIACNKKTDLCPVFFDDHASKIDDHVAGGMCFFISMVVLFFCLAGLVTTLQKLLLGVSSRVICKATKVNGYIAILMGTCLTVLVQSSSITTSVLTPLVGMGVLRLEQMFPLTLGANVGTTMTAIMSAMVTEGTESLRVALAHLFFNLSGIAIWYPLPFMREIPLRGARQLGKGTRLWHGFPVVYIAVAFFIFPATLLGISSLYEQKTKGLTALGVFLTLILISVIAKLLHWLYSNNGGENEEGETTEETSKDKKTSHIGKGRDQVQQHQRKQRKQRKQRQQFGDGSESQEEERKEEITQDKRTSHDVQDRNQRRKQRSKLRNQARLQDEVEGFNDESGNYENQEQDTTERRIRRKKDKPSHGGDADQQGQDDQIQEKHEQWNLEIEV